MGSAETIQKEHGRVPTPLQFFCVNVYLGVALVEKPGPPCKTHVSEGSQLPRAWWISRYCRLSGSSSCYWGAWHSLERNLGCMGSPKLSQLWPSQTPLTAMKC